MPIPIKRAIEFDCHKGEHEEAEKCPSHPCWCWLKTHTYELPYRARLISIDATVVVPKTAIQYTDYYKEVIYVEVSEDKKEWKTIYEYDVSKEKPESNYIKIKVVLPLMERPVIKYYRFRTKYWYVDGSRGKLVVRPLLMG